MASRICALNGFLGSVDFGVTRSMTRSCESLLAAVAVAVPAGIALPSLLGAAELAELSSSYEFERLVAT